MLVTHKAERQFTEAEAAGALGLSIEQFRELVSMHISPDTPAPARQSAVYRAADLLVLRFLASQARATAAG